MESYSQSIHASHHEEEIREEYCFRLRVENRLTRLEMLLVIFQIIPAILLYKSFF
jgi:hypothetical protein